MSTKLILISVVVGLLLSASGAGAWKCGFFGLSFTGGCAVFVILMLLLTVFCTIHHFIP